MEAEAGIRWKAGPHTRRTVPECSSGYIHSKEQISALSTFKNNCLVGEYTFGDPFQDSGVGTNLGDHALHVGRNQKPKVSGFGFQVLGFGVQVSKVSGFGFQVWGLGFGVGVWGFESCFG